MEPAAAPDIARPAPRTGDLVITKANALIEASYKLTLNEQRLILSCIAQLDGRKPLPKDNIFTVTAVDFADRFDIEQRHAYEALREAANNLYQRDIRRIEGKVQRNTRWVYEAEYREGEGRISLGFSPKIAPYLTLLHKKFTSYNIRAVEGLKSVYSIRLFEMLMQFKDTGVFVISVDDFRDRLDLGDKYDRFANLKARVINPAIEELEARSNIEIKLKIHKKSRKPVRLEFHFAEKQQLELL